MSIFTNAFEKKLLKMGKNNVFETEVIKYNTNIHNTNDKLILGIAVCRKE